MKITYCMKAKSSIPLNKSKWIFHFSLKMSQHFKGFTGSVEKYWGVFFSFIVFCIFAL